MRVGVLGPVVLDHDGGSREPEAKVRALLTVLAVHLGSPVSVGTLVEALWGDRPPTTAEKTLQGHVSALRRQLGADVVVTTTAGYALELPTEEVDVAQFERLIDEASRTGASDWTGARDGFQAALELWRGEALTDLADSPLRTGLQARLGELHDAALRGRIAADLALGRHHELLPELRQLVADEPTRDDLRADLMLALYRSDRQVEALEVYREFRRTLLEELGLDPSPRLQELERQILLHDPELDPIRPPTDNLPTPLDRFIGRERQVAEIRALLREHRLVTLLGPGGVGKSRLALEVATAEIPTWDGVWWVDLANVTEGAAVLGKLARSVGVAAASGVRLEDAVGAHLRGRAFLLAVDNCEHVLGAASVVVERILAGSPRSTVLATSRVPLGLQGEHRHPVPPLELAPASDPDPRDAESVHLFVERAAARGVHLSTPDEIRAAAELCRRVDGLPLAIELLATRTAMMAPDELVERLSDSSGLLTVDAEDREPRHRSMQVAFDRGLDLLEPDLQVALFRLAVFPGDFDLEAAIAVAFPGDDTSTAAERLGVLVEASLLTVQDGPGPRRFRLLELVRDHAGLHLGQGPERTEAQRRHAEHFRDLAVAAGHEIEGADAARWIALVGHEDHNLRAAIEWFLAGDRAEDALAFAPAIGHVWYVQGDLAGCRELLTRLLRSPGDVPPELRARAHLRLAWPTFLGGDMEGGFAHCREAERAFEAAGDAAGVAHTLRDRAHMLLLGAGDTDAALPLYRRAIELLDAPGSEHDRAWVQITMAQALLLADRETPELVEALDEAEVALVGASDARGLAHLSMDRVFVAYAADDMEALERAAHAEIGYSRSVGDTVYEQIGLIALGLLAAVYDRTPDRRRAEALLQRAMHLAWDTGNLLQLGIALQAVAAVTVAQDARAAARLWGAAMALSPAWPLFQRRYGELVDPYRRELGDDFDREVQAGGALDPEASMELAGALLVADVHLGSPDLDATAGSPT